MRAIPVVLTSVLLTGAGATAVAVNTPQNIQQFNVSDSAVKVEHEAGHGSGVHIGKGLILTAAHAARSGKDIKVKTQDGKELPATVLWIGETHDIALLRVDESGLASASLQCEREPEGSAVRAVGYPLSLEHISLRGYVSKAQASIPPLWPDVQLLDLSAAPGMSGGPVFDVDGNVVGLITAIYPTGVFGVWGLITASVSGPAICGMLAENPIS